MKRKFLIILAVLAVLIAGVIIVAATRPDDFRYSRSATLSAPASAVFEQVNDLHKFQAWNPWAKIDPSAKTTFSGPDSGVGASFSWDGNNEVGAGTMTLIENKPGELVRFKMEFKKPFEATNSAEFTFKAEGDKTVVTWSMFGKNTFMGKAVGLFMDCDKMCGDQFLKGLENLRGIVEGTPKS